MFKNFFKAAMTVVLATSLSGCFFSGDKVEIPTGHVGKIQTKDGFQADVRSPSKFRLDACLRFCDRLVMLDVSDTRYTENFKTFMPLDDLEMGYSITMTLMVDPKKYDSIFGNIPFQELGDGRGFIAQDVVYGVYAQPQLQTVIPEILTAFTIGEVASERTKVNDYLKAQLNKELKATPFILKHVGLTNTKYPDIITRAKERAAERKEAQDQVLAQKTLDLLKIQTEKEVEAQRRVVELMKATTKAQIADKLLSEGYIQLQRLEVLEALAQSENKVFVPTDMLDGIAIQQEMAK